MTTLTSAGTNVATLRPTSNALRDLRAVAPGVVELGGSGDGRWHGSTDRTCRSEHRDPGWDAGRGRGGGAHLGSRQDVVMTALVAMACLGLVSYLLRGLFVVLVPAERLPGPVRDALGHLPPAVLAALVSVEVAGAVRGLDVARAAFLLGELLVAGIAVRLTRSMGLGVSIGLVAALLLDLLS